MIIPCFRCGKELDSPNDGNADYIIAEDTIVKEPREVFIALTDNQATLEKRAKMLEVNDSEYDKVEVPSIEEARRIIGLAKIVVEIQEKDIQKTGVVCPKCYKKTDFVIWGVHKKR